MCDQKPPLSRSSRLEERLSAARRRNFVGREVEIEKFVRALRSKADAPQVFHIYGLGGIGKSSLLREFAAICADIGAENAIVPLWLDGNGIDVSEEGFRAALDEAVARPLHLPSGSPPPGLLSGADQRFALLIDTYERLQPLDNWIRETLLPQLGETTVVVFAGRLPSSSAWRSDAGWRSLLCPIPLRNLSPSESRQFLQNKRIAEEQFAAVLNFTHGHPLSLALVADLFAERPDLLFAPNDAPDTVKTLLDHLLQVVPSDAHRGALEACSLVRRMNEDLLADMLDHPGSTHGLFDWLRGLSLMESDARGTFPHDLAREVLAADLAWRDPDQELALRQRAHVHYQSRLDSPDAQAAQNLLLDYMFLHRHVPLVRPFVQWEEGERLTVQPAGASDQDATRAIVTGHEGAGSAAILQDLMDRQPDNVLVLRDGRAVRGLLALVDLRPEDNPVASDDPAVLRVWRFLAEHGGLRRGERVTIFRFWMAADTYQTVSPIQSQIFANIVRHCLTQPGLAYSFFCCADAAFWTPLAAYTDMKRLPDLDFAVEGRDYGVFGNDWRTLPPLRWLALLGEREKSKAAQVPTPLPAAAALVTLSQAEFGAAVSHGLRNLKKPAALRENPLLRSRLVLNRATAESGSGPVAGLGRTPGQGACAAALSSLLQEACLAQNDAPHTQKYYRVLSHVFLKPTTTQAAAAELLDMPFSTFRRHLTSGEAAVTEWLWLREIGA